MSYPQRCTKAVNRRFLLVAFASEIPNRGCFSGSCNADIQSVVCLAMGRHLRSISVQRATLLWAASLKRRRAAEDFEDACTLAAAEDALNQLLDEDIDIPMHCCTTLLKAKRHSIGRTSCCVRREAKGTRRMREN